MLFFFSGAKRGKSMNQGLKPDLYIVLARTAVPSGERGVPCQKAASISVVVITHSYRFNQKQIHVGIDQTIFGRGVQWLREMARKTLQTYFQSVSGRGRDMEVITVVFMQVCARSLSHHR